MTKSEYKVTTWDIQIGGLKFTQGQTWVELNIDGRWQHVSVDSLRELAQACNQAANVLENDLK